MSLPPPPIIYTQTPPVSPPNTGAGLQGRAVRGRLRWYGDTLDDDDDDDDDDHDTSASTTP